MPASDAAFNQVRHILGKLDRSIDQARSRRLNADGGDQVVEPSRPEPGDRPSIPSTNPPGPGGHTTGGSVPKGPEAQQASTGTPGETPAPLSENAKIYGRAKPIRSSGVGFDGKPNPGSASKAG